MLAIIGRTSAKESSRSMLVGRLLGPESSGRIRSRLAHAINPPHVRGQRGSYRRVNAIIHPIFEACCQHNLGEPSKVQVTHRREEVLARSNARLTPPATETCAPISKAS